MGSSETTEWEDIQRKFGNLPATELVIDETQVENLVDNVAADFTGDHKYDHMDWDELELLDDTVTEEEERLLEDIRKKRMQELQESMRGPTFGFLIDLPRKTDFENEVTMARAAFVVVLMYQPKQLESEIIEAVLQTLARKFSKVKFVKIIANVCIPNYADSLIPTLLIYHDGKVVRQYVGLAHFGGKKLTPEDIEWELAQNGVLHTTLEDNPHTSTKDRVFLNVKRK